MSRSLPLLGALPFFLLAQQGSASAQTPHDPVVARVDVNGDGRLDEVHVRERGGIDIQIAGRRSAGAWTPLAASGAVLQGRVAVDTQLVPGKTVLLVTSLLRRPGGHTFAEAVALLWTPGSLRTLWRGSVGAVGPEGESTLTLELGRYGLIKYRSRTGVSRCDGKTAYLDAERYDFVAGRFRSAHQPLRMALADARPTLLAREGAPDLSLAGSRAQRGTAPSWFRASSASSSLSAVSVSDLVAPLALTDGNNATAWVENSGGTGRGEFVTLRSSMGPLHVTALRLTLGHGAAPKGYNRPKRLGIILSPTDSYWVEFPRDPKQRTQWVVLPKAVLSRCVSLVVDTVYPVSPHKPSERTAISEIAVYSSEETDLEGRDALLASHIASSRNMGNRRILLQNLGDQAEPALLAAIAQRTEAGAGSHIRELRRLRLALASIGAAPDELIKGLANASNSKRDISEFSQGLRRAGSASIGPLRAALDDPQQSAAAVARIATVLAQRPQHEALEALVAALGIGGQARRMAVIRGLTKGINAVSRLLEALQTEPNTTKRADLYRALGGAAARSPAESEERNRAAAALANALLYSEPPPYEEHLRLLQAAARIGPRPDLREALIHEFSSLEDRQDGAGLALLRQTAIALAQSFASGGAPSLPAEVAAGSAPGTRLSATLRKALRKALQHRDPGVRIATLGALSTRGPWNETIATLLVSDAWPEVRRAAAGMMVLRCDAASAVALRRATLIDSDSAVARTAFAGLLRCDNSELFALSLSLLATPNRPMDVRLQAARALGSLATTSAQRREVLAQFANARRLALSSRSHGNIATALARSLAAVDTADAVTALNGAASDPAFPQLQAAALSALGGLCAPTSIPIMRALLRSHQHGVATAARQALGRCTR